MVQDISMHTLILSLTMMNGCDRYLSEDYMFCQLARKIGITTWMCPWMSLSHIGSYIFNGTLKDLGNLEYAAHGADMKTRPHKAERDKKLKKVKKGKKK